MLEWIEAGAKLGWMIDPSRRMVTIYRPCREPEEQVGVWEIAGEGPVEGFVLDLGPVWDPEQV
jgi:Uma2 family endonuclease